MTSALFSVDGGPLSDAERAELTRRDDEFVHASTNVDEDLHFSTLYLESTLAPPDARWGLSTWYSELVALNRQALERYYLRSDECRAVSSELTDLVFGDPAILVSLLHEIERRSGLLDTAFPFGWLESGKQAVEPAELIELYQRHLSLHQYLYAVARLPEALDRGTGAFTARLRQLIDARAPGGAPPDALATLSAVGRPSIFRQEQLDFVALLDSLTEAERDAVERARSGALALMALAPDARTRLDAHRKRWAPLFYHGYGNREQLELIELAARLRQVLRKGVGTILPRIPTQDESEALASSLRLSAQEIACFYAYGLLGWTKARRRWFQLRNFQRLDLLIELLARELDCAEWDLRVLLPQEVLSWLETGERPAEAIAARYDSAILWFKDSSLRIAAIPRDFRFDGVADPLRAHYDGEQIVRGRVTGRCVMTSRGGTPPDEEVPYPSILVVAQLDSDLVWTLPFYDGLVVEERGASAHASIVAREIGIPTVAGVMGATRIFSPGDEITVDGDAGVVLRERPGALPG